MKSYKLTTWPDLPAAFLHVSYARILTDLSQRWVTAEKLEHTTGVERPVIQAFLAYLTSQGLLDIRETEPATTGRFSFGFGTWLRRM